MTRTIRLLASLLLLSAALSAQNTATFKKLRADTLEGGFFCLDQSPDGVFWVGSLGTHSNLMRLQEDGNLLQSIRFKEVDNYSPNWIWDIEAAADNGAWALFYLHDTTVSQDVAHQLIRFDGAGNLRWQRTLTKPQLTTFSETHLSTDLDENAYALSKTTGSVDTAWVQVHKTGPAGEPIWSKAYQMPTGYPYIYHAACLADGSFLVGGLSGPYTNDRTGFLLNIGPDGQVLWGKTYPDFSLRNFVELPGGDLLLTGEDGGRSMLVRTDHAGAIKWGQSWTPASSIGIISTLAQNTDGNLLLMDGCGADVVCISPDGDFLWAKNYDPCRVALIPDGIGTRDGGIAFVEFGRRLIKTDAAGNTGGCATFDVNLTFSPQNVVHSNFSATSVDLPLPPQLTLEAEAHTVEMADFCHDTLPVFSIAQSADTVCAGQRLRVSAVGGSPADAYLWTFSGGQPASSTARVDSTFFPKKGQQLLRLEVAYGRCRDTLQSTVTVAPFATTLDLGPDTLLCGGAMPLLLDATATANPSGPLTYLWENGTAAPLRTVTQSGTYRVTAALGLCADADTIQVKFAAAPLALPTDTLLCLGQALTLSAGSAGGEIFWNGLPGSTEFVTADSGWVQRLVRYGMGCAFADSVLVHRADCDSEFGYYAPNVFWPEAQDATNTVFQIFPNDAQVALLQVHDRWGSLIFESAAPNAAWDGRIRGRDALPGVYVWQALLRKPLGQERRLFGAVTLLR